MNEIAEGGLLDAATEALGYLVDEVNRLVESGVFKEIGANVGRIVGDLVKNVPKILHWVKEFADLIGRLVPIAIELGKALIIIWAVEEISRFAGLLRTLPALFTGAAVGAGTLTAAMGPLAVAIAAAVAAGEGLGWVFDQFAQISTKGMKAQNAEMKAFNEALKITYGSIAEFSRLTGMSAEEAYNYAKGLEEAGKPLGQCARGRRPAVRGMPV
jgi:hypothetical protein